MVADAREVVRFGTGHECAKTGSHLRASSLELSWRVMLLLLSGYRGNLSLRAPCASLLPFSDMVRVPRRTSSPANLSPRPSSRRAVRIAPLLKDGACRTQTLWPVWTLRGRAGLGGSRGCGRLCSLLNSIICPGFVEFGALSVRHVFYVSTQPNSRASLAASPCSRLLPPHVKSETAPPSNGRPRWAASATAPQGQHRLEGQPARTRAAAIRGASTRDQRAGRQHQVVAAANSQCRHSLAFGLLTPSLPTQEAEQERPRVAEEYSVTASPFARGACLILSQQQIPCVLPAHKLCAPRRSADVALGENQVLAA